MANVLPKDSLRELRSSYRTRFILAGSLVASIVAGAVLIALVPSYAMVKAEQERTEAKVAEFPQNDEQEDIMRAQMLVRAFKPLTASATSSLTIFDDIFSVRPAGVVLSSVGLVKGQEGSIAISGRASSREQINAYRAALSENPIFESVEVPIGVFVGAEGGSFSMTITGAF